MKIGLFLVIFGTKIIDFVIFVFLQRMNFTVFRVKIRQKRSDFCHFCSKSQQFFQNFSRFEKTCYITINKAYFVSKIGVFFWHPCFLTFWTCPKWSKYIRYCCFWQVRTPVFDPFWRVRVRFWRVKNPVFGLKQLFLPPLFRCSAIRRWLFGRQNV